MWMWSDSALASVPPVWPLGYFTARRAKAGEGDVQRHETEGETGALVTQREAEMPLVVDA